MVHELQKNVSKNHEKVEINQPSRFFREFPATLETLFLEKRL